MSFFRFLSAAWWQAGLLPGAAVLLALPASAQTEKGFFAPATARALFSVGWQVGQYAQHGMGNMYYHALRLNRSPNVAALDQKMTWTPTYGGLCLGLTVVQARSVFEIRWSNRHTIQSAKWTDQAGQEWNTSYRVRLNELTLGLGYPLWGGRLRPGLSADLGLFRVSRRDGTGSEKGKWVSMHSQGEGLLEPGERSPTVGLTLYCDVAPFGSRGAGLTLRPFYQWHLIEPDLFGLAGTTDTRSFQYGVHNYGLALSWGFTAK